MKHERRLSAEGVNLAKGVKPASPKLGLGCLSRNDNPGHGNGTHDAGHGKGFREVATKIGLSGKMTATVAGEDLIPVLRDYSAFLGEYPHASLSSERGSGWAEEAGDEIAGSDMP